MVELGNGGSVGEQLRTNFLRTYDEDAGRAIQMNKFVSVLQVDSEWP